MFLQFLMCFLATGIEASSYKIVITPAPGTIAAAKANFLKSLTRKESFSLKIKKKVWRGPEYTQYDAEAIADILIADLGQLITYAFGETKYALDARIRSRNTLGIEVYDKDCWYRRYTIRPNASKELHELIKLNTKFSEFIEALIKVLQTKSKEWKREESFSENKESFTTKVNEYEAHACSKLPVRCAVCTCPNCKGKGKIFVRTKFSSGYETCDECEKGRCPPLHLAPFWTSWKSVGEVRRRRGLQNHPRFVKLCEDIAAAHHR